MIGYEAINNDFHLICVKIKVFQSARKLNLNHLIETPNIHLQKVQYLSRLGCYFAEASKYTV